MQPRGTHLFFFVVMSTEEDLKEDQGRSGQTISQRTIPDSCLGNDTYHS